MCQTGLYKIDRLLPSHIHLLLAPDAEWYVVCSARAFAVCKRVYIQVYVNNKKFAWRVPSTFSSFLPDLMAQ